MEYRCDIICVIELACRDQSGHEGIEAVMVGFRAAKLSSESPERIGGDRGFSILRGEP